jgi:site-specific recombinase XerD
MASASDPIDGFARFLAQSEHSSLTIKNYRSDLDAFAAWFEGANSEPMEPAKITPTDLRQFKRWMVEQRRLKPNTVNCKLATLRSFLSRATREGWPPVPIPTPGQALSGPRPVPHEQPG